MGASSNLSLHLAPNVAQTDLILELLPEGFSVGDGKDTNDSGVPCYYLAFRR